MANYDWIGSELIEKGIIETPIFERFPKLIPFVGDNYDNKNHSKLLLVAESNYFPNELESESNFKDAEKWYKGDKNRLIPEKIKEKVNNAGKIFYLNGLLNSMQKLLNTAQYDDIAFYNYFLRPANNINGSKGFGDKNYYTDLDGEVAFSAFCGILKEIKPNLVIFATKFGYDKMEYFRKKTKTDFGNIVIERVAHPSCKWWTVFGKQDFENYLCEYWLKEKPKYYLNFEKLQSIHKELKLMFIDKYVKEACYKEGDLSYSQLHFKIRDYTFCFQIEIKKEEAHYWSYFYHTNECKILHVNFKEEKYKYDFLSTDNNETIIAEINKRIQQIFNELSR